MCIGTGTAWVLTATTEKLVAPFVDGAYICNHPAGGGGQLASLNTGGSAISLAMEKIGESEFTSQRVDELINSAPVGCDGLKCVELTNTKITFASENSRHTPGHYVRAVVEGLAEKLREYLQKFSLGGFTANRLIMCGKVSTSGPVSQIVADVTGLPVICLSESDVSAYGATIIAASLGGSKNTLKSNAEKLGLNSKTILSSNQSERK